MVFIKDKIFNTGTIFIIGYFLLGMISELDHLVGIETILRKSNLNGIQVVVFLIQALILGKIVKLAYEFGRWIEK